MSRVSRRGNSDRVGSSHDGSFSCPTFGAGKGQCSVPLFGYDWVGAIRVRSHNGQACPSNVVCSPSNVVCSHVVDRPRGGFIKEALHQLDEFSFKSIPYFICSYCYAIG